MKRFILVTVLWFIGAACAQTTDVKGVEIGAPFDQAKGLFERIRCGGGKPGKRDLTCTHIGEITAEDVRARTEPVPFTFGGAVSKVVVIHSLDGKFAGIRMALHPRHYENVVGALTSKFGKPTSQSPLPFKTRAGVEYDNEETIWTRSDAVIAYRRLAGTVDEGSLTIYSNELIAFRDAERKAQQEQARKDL